MTKKISLFWICLIAVICIFTIAAAGIFWEMRRIYSGVENARKTSEILKTPSDQLTAKDLSIKKSVLDRDIDIMMANANFNVFEPYFSVTRASDGHRTYLGMCSDDRAKSVLDRLQTDSPEKPGCRDSDTQAIIFVVNNQDKILCVDIHNVNAVTLIEKPVGLTCK